MFCRLLRLVHDCPRNPLEIQVGPSSPGKVPLHRRLSLVFCSSPRIPERGKLRMSLTENQRLVLRAICDGVFHSHTGNEAAEMAEAVPLGAPQYQQEKGDCFSALHGDRTALILFFIVDFLIRANFTDLPGSVDILLEQYRNAFSKQNYDQLMLTLSLLSTRAGTFLLTGHLTPFYLLTIEERENVVKAWSTSKILLRRKAYRGFACKSLALFTSVFLAGTLIYYPLIQLSLFSSLIHILTIVRWPPDTQPSAIP